MKTIYTYKLIIFLVFGMHLPFRVHRDSNHACVRVLLHGILAFVRTRTDIIDN